MKGKKKSFLLTEALLSLSLLSFLCIQVGMILVQRQERRKIEETKVEMYLKMREKVLHPQQKIYGPTLGGSEIFYERTKEKARLWTYYEGKKYEYYWQK